jgi:pyruvate/2-oxoglutarate/acetoin dehydrogenase E1 component
MDEPPRRICALPAPNPFSPVLEDQMLPTPDKVAQEIRQMVRA